ncbi:MAG TPA: hypothetical protein VEJ63_01035 [Planctomycetota bacterium]|nr:hypothetical protein [Planctomycetota bacterium]
MPESTIESTPEIARLKYWLNRRDRWRAHLIMWMGYPAGMFLVVLVPLAAIIFLAIEISPWFLLLLTFQTNLWRFAAGIIQPLLWGGQEIEVRIDEKSVHFASGNEKFSHTFEEIEEISRFNPKYWSVQFRDGIVLHVPAAAIEERYIEYMKSKIPPPPPGACTKPGWRWG